MDTAAKEALREKQAQSRGLRGAGGTFGSLTKRFDGKEEKRVSDSASL